MQEWHEAQKRQVGRMDDATLEKELVFAEACAPATTSLEQTWLDELRAERERRQAVTA